MLFDTVFLVALQSSLVLGLIHGINPCGHSWLVLAPFVYGEKDGKRVFSLTAAFILGTSLACLAIGVTLGSVSMMLPESMQHIVDLATAGVLVILGAILIVKPELLHSHDHEHAHGHDEHDHSHGHSHNHDSQQNHSHEHVHLHDHAHSHHGHHTCSHHHEGHSHCDGSGTSENSHAKQHAHDHHAHGGCGCTKRFTLKNVSVWGLFTIGFMNMIVPCPTVAIMYSYALDSGSALKATLVFASYAVGTGIALAGVIYAIYKVANMMRTLNQHWIEPMVMRTAGVMTIAFGIYSYMLDNDMLGMLA